jgi:AcrR family transcriptional regulator
MARPSMQAARREQILDALYDVAADGGLRGASITDIAAAAELPRSALHYFFASKDEIETAFVARIGDRYLANLARARAAAPSGAAVAHVVRWHFRADDEKAARVLNVWLDFWGAAAARPAIGAVVYGIQERARDELAQALVADAPALAGDALRYRAAACLALVEGGLLQWRLSMGAPRPLDPLVLADALVRALEIP